MAVWEYRKDLKMKSSSIHGRQQRIKDRDPKRCYRRPFGRGEEVALVAKGGSWRGLNDEPLENNPSVAFTDALFFHSRSSPVSLSHAYTCVRLFRSDRWYGRVFVSRLAPTIVALPGQNGSMIDSLKKKRREEWLEIEVAVGVETVIHRGSGSPRSDHIISCRQHRTTCPNRKRIAIERMIRLAQHATHE
ncbi:hypothetical protein DBV15_08539 [Temnothorax longispinosus]|uniref:Uncharacterized protein n=1 Tax=Temnothorax longispinosus TaxID=300112 RepID=A0A4S2KZ03_9HYME|nr:hypothetical protein DBV15_08539 [Temnothorax longispinosus]